MTDDELRQLFDALRTESEVARQENAAAHEETRRLSKVTAEELRGEIQLVAEAVIKVDEKLDRTAADIRAEMRQGFAETQAMIKFSYSELDRRVRTLEDGIADLQTRVERLEESKTH